MTYAAIMVHAECGERAEARIRLAAHLANLFDAMLIGVGAEIQLSSHEAASLHGSEQLAQFQEEAVRTDIMAAQRRFEPIASHVVAGHEWRSAIDFPDRFVIRESRVADLIILAPVGDARIDPHCRVDPGEVLMRGGRPILVAPTDQTTLNPCRVVIGWKDGRETRRTVSDALPFLLHATQVRVVEVCDEAARADAESRVNDVAASLGRHGATAAGEVVIGQDANASALLQAVCDAWEADLLVVGGYGHSRTHEWIFGGVTRDLLKGRSTPALLSH